MQEQFDVVVIGAGPGGYACAIRAAQLGRRVLIADTLTNPDAGDAPALGGVCANMGCIPSKALLAVSEKYEALRSADPFGCLQVADGAVQVDMQRVQAHRARCVLSSNKGIAYLFRKYRVESVCAQARFTGKTAQGWQLALHSDAGTQTVTAGQVVVACGSAPRELPFAAVDEQRILSSTGALRLQQVPQRLGIIGAGVIALELGTVWRRFGAAVTVFESADTLLPMADTAVARAAAQFLGQQGLVIELGVRVTAVQTVGEAVQVTCTDASGVAKTQHFDRVIVAVGRVPAAGSVDPAAVGLALDERGRITVDANCRTNLPGVWAIGDVVRGPMLAHKAQLEALAVAEQLAGQRSRADLAGIASVIYTQPEMAWVGLSEQAAEQAGHTVRTATVPFAANGRARAGCATQGFVKVVAAAHSGDILGVHIVGDGAAELIGQACTALAFEATAEDMALVCPAHPSLTETLNEAMRVLSDQAVNT